MDFVSNLGFSGASARMKEKRETIEIDREGEWGTRWQYLMRESIDDEEEWDEESYCRCILLSEMFSVHCTRNEWLRDLLALLEDYNFSK